MATIIHDFVPLTDLNSGRKALLLAPPVYDTRFPWIQWHQPVALLQLATLLKSFHGDVRLIDCLRVEQGKHIRRHRVRILDRGGVPINYWRYGITPHNLRTQLKALGKEGWQPDDVYIEGFTTYWWEGIHEAIAEVRASFPATRIILLGAYPTLAPEHAATSSGADIVVVDQVPSLLGLPLDIAIRDMHQSFSYISIGKHDRPANEILDEIRTSAKPTKGRPEITSFVFADHDVISRFGPQFKAVLQGVIDDVLRVGFYALGNIRPRDIVADPELADLMRRARFKQIVFSDDRDIEMTPAGREGFLEELRAAIGICRDAGYATGTDSVVTSISLGRPGEDLNTVVEMLVEAAHIAGALIPWPYQPAPSECPADLPLEMQNGKVFPFAERNGLTYRAYQDVIALAAILNAKYRSKTFDFLGDGLIPRLVRSSLENQSWNPVLTDSLVPKKPITLGYFNKEGKWVRS